MCNQHVRVHVYIYKKKAFVYMIAYKTTSLEAVQSTYIQRRISALDSSIPSSDRFHCIANSHVKATLTDRLPLGTPPQKKESDAETKLRFTGRNR